MAGIGLRHSKGLQKPDENTNFAAYPFKESFAHGSEHKYSRRCRCYHWCTAYMLRNTWQKIPYGKNASWQLRKNFFAELLFAFWPDFWSCFWLLLYTLLWWPLTGRQR